jgi:molybdate transport system substrate-binding protein
MTLRSIAAAAAILSTAAVALQSGAQAAEIVVYGTVAAKAALQQIVPAFEHDTGNKVTLRVATTGELREAIEKGAAVDVAILTNAALDDLAGKGKIDGASKVNVAKSGAGVAVKKGAPLPAIATSEEFKKSLLAAKSIAYSATGATGTLIQKVFSHYHISEEMQAKTVIIHQGTAPEAVGRGEAEMGFTQISEILDAPGAQLVGPLPADVQVYSAFAAALGSGSTDNPAAKAFMTVLTAPSTKALLKAKGLEVE